MRHLGSAFERRALISLFAAALVIGGVHVLVLAPHIRQTGELRAQSAALAREEAAMADGTRDMMSWLREHQGRPRADFSADSLSPGSAVSALLQKLSELGEAHGVEVTGVRPEAPGAPVTVTPGDGSTRTYACLPVHVSARGEYRRLGEFLSDLEAHGGLARVRSVQLTLDREHHALAADILIDAYGRLT